MFQCPQLYVPRSTSSSIGSKLLQTFGEFPWDRFLEVKLLEQRPWLHLHSLKSCTAGSQERDTAAPLHCTTPGSGWPSLSLSHILTLVRKGGHQCSLRSRGRPTVGSDLALQVPSTLRMFLVSKSLLCHTGEIAQSVKRLPQSNDGLSSPQKLHKKLVPEAWRMALTAQAEDSGLVLSHL